MRAPCCNHLWGAYEDYCHCSGVCHNRETCMNREPLCPMSRTEENDLVRNNPEYREVAYAFQLHDMTRMLFQVGHLPDDELRRRNFEYVLNNIESQIQSYRDSK